MFNHVSNDRASPIRNVWAFPGQSSAIVRSWIKKKRPPRPHPEKRINPSVPCRCPPRPHIQRFRRKTHRSVRAGPRGCDRGLLQVAGPQPHRLVPQRCRSRGSATRLSLLSCARPRAPRAVVHPPAAATPTRQHLRPMAKYHRSTHGNDLTVFVRRCVVYASEPRKSLRLHDEDDWRCEAVSPTFPKGRRVKWDYGSGRILLPILSPSFSGMLQAFSEKPKCTKSFLKANMLSVLEVTFVILVLSITVFEFRFKRKRSLVSINGNTSEGSIDRFRYSTVRPE